MSCTLTCFRYFRKPISSGRNISSACPRPPSPRAVRPTRWIYSYSTHTMCMIITGGKSLNMNHKKMRGNLVFKKRKRINSPLDHREDRTGRSNRLRECPSHEQRHRCKVECHFPHYKTGKKWLFASLAFVDPVKDIKMLESCAV